MEKVRHQARTGDFIIHHQDVRLFQRRFVHKERFFPGETTSGRHDRRSETAYRGEKERRFHRLGQKFHPSSLQRIGSRFLMANEPGQKKNGNIPKAQITRCFARKIPAVLPRHIDIEQHDVGPELQRSGQSTNGFVHDHHFILAGVLKDHAGEPRKIYVVIHNQHTSLAHACLRAGRVRIWLAGTTEAMIGRGQKLAALLTGGITFHLAEL
jgi:hypothetical protein